MAQRSSKRNRRSRKDTARRRRRVAGLGAAAGAFLAAATTPLANAPAGPLEHVAVSIDSGGLTGFLPSSVLDTGQTSGTVPAGTIISIYTGNGETLLYSYTTTGTDGPFVGTGNLVNSGYIPFNLGPVYIGESPSGFGTTTFDS